MNVGQLPVEARKYIQELEENLERSNATWKTKYDHLVDEYRLLLYKRFGRSSERVDVTQELLFDASEQISPQDDGNEIEPVTVNSYTREKRGRKPLDEKLPREEIIHDIPEQEKQCACGAELQKIGEEVSERLQVIPEQIYVERHVRPKYACRRCEGSGDEDKPAVRIASAVPSIIPQSIVTPGLLAFVFVNKYVDHLPFYRQERRFERIGIHLSRQDMSNWQRQVFEVISPLIGLLKHHIKSGPAMLMDETPVQVMGEPSRKDTQKSYMWLARGGPPGKPAVLYEYRETRGSQHVQDFIEGFSGFLQTDGYPGYDKAVSGREDIIHVGCFAHARRKFHDAAKASKKTGAAHAAMAKIKKLYDIERLLRSEALTEEDFVNKRRDAAEPVLVSFKRWLDGKVDRVAPESLLGKAVHYALRQWEKMIRYLDSPNLAPDTNAAENSIRPFVLGRKNWLFSGSPGGAESSCALYSLIESAKQNGMNPYHYLRVIFEVAPRMKNTGDWDVLLPWNIPAENGSVDPVGKN
jgi:transposase